MTAPATPGVGQSIHFGHKTRASKGGHGGRHEIMALPGSANLIGGRGVTLHMIPRKGVVPCVFPVRLPGLKWHAGKTL